MTIEVSRCWECPFAVMLESGTERVCNRVMVTIPTKNRIDGPLPQFCPLLKESLVIKKKQNEDIGNTD